MSASRSSQLVRPDPWRHGLTSRRPASPSSAATSASRQIYEGTNGVQAMDLVGRKLVDGRRRDRARLSEPLDGLAEAAGLRLADGGQHRSTESARRVCERPSPRRGAPPIGWSTRGRSGGSLRWRRPPICACFALIGRRRCISRRAAHRRRTRPARCGASRSSYARHVLAAGASARGVGEILGGGRRLSV